MDISFDKYAHGQDSDAARTGSTGKAKIKPNINYLPFLVNVCTSILHENRSSQRFFLVRNVSLTGA